MTSGENPMDRPPPRADAGLDSMAETRKVEQMRERVQAGYRVDPDAVAEAIITRLKAGTGGARNPASSQRPPAR